MVDLIDSFYLWDELIQSNRIYHSLFHQLLSLPFYFLLYLIPVGARARVPNWFAEKVLHFFLEHTHYA